MVLNLLNCYQNQYFELMETLSNYINEKHGELVLPRFKVEQIWDDLTTKMDPTELLNIISKELNFTQKNDIIMKLNDKMNLIDTEENK